MEWSRNKCNSVQTLAIVALIAVLPACGSGGAPDPASSDVRELVLSVSLDVVRNALLAEVGSDETGMAPETMLQYGYPEFDYQAWAKMRHDSELLERIVSEVERRTADLGMGLENMRVESSDTDLRRVVCRANLRLANGNTLDIRYLAQYTEDNRLYVEVEVLE